MEGEVAMRLRTPQCLTTPPPLRQQPLPLRRPLPLLLHGRWRDGDDERRLVDGSGIVRRVISASGEEGATPATDGRRRLPELLPLKVVQRHEEDFEYLFKCLNIELS